MSNFNENTRVQVPAALHLVRLGYTYLSNIEDDDYDHSTNILKDVFCRSISRLNPLMTDVEIKNFLGEIIRMCRDNEDLGREFYNTLTASSGTRIVDFENPANNEWHVTTEFTCENKKTTDNFRPDITVFVNGMPLVFIEVKKPNNYQGILAERNRMDTRMSNKAFKSFFNITQFMIFSNNEEYNSDTVVPISGAFYCTSSKNKVFFSTFREEDRDLLLKVGFNYDISDEVEKEILLHRNCPQLRSLPEYKTNQQPTTPTNRIITSMLSKERLLFILKYGIAYVEKKKKIEKNGKEEEIQELQKHIMRYQQLFATYAIRATLDKGLKGGIIWHTQGSGKTALSYYNVKSLTDYYAKLNSVVKFYFVVDRLDLMEQATAEFAERGLIVRNASDRKTLMDDFADNSATHNSAGKPEIMVVNIQKFATDHHRIKKSEVYSTNLKRVFFIDEAHRGYNPKGSFLANLFEADKDAIKLALTGTPLIREERESWRIFGDYIHKYYYDKSISDGYTLKIMCEDIETVYKEEIMKILDRLTKDVEVKKSDIDHNDIIEHESYVGSVLDYILRDIKRSRVQQAAPHMGGMIVCETNPQARKMYELFQNKQEKEKEPLKASLILHDEGDKVERKMEIETFKKTESIDFLIVNAMLLTGFDAPRLKKLYLMRKLDGHTLLQALTRVNRPYMDFKMGYVVDFANIKENFIDTNNMYLRELNRTNEEYDSEDLGEGAGNAVMVSNDEVIQHMSEIKEVLFNYAIENAEEFSRQINEIKDKEQLYKLRHTLEDAKALSNQVRSFGDDELKERFATMAIGSIPSLISEVQHRIQRVNLLESTDHKADVSGIIREVLSMMEFEFRSKGREELQMVYNDLRERYTKIEIEFGENIDREDDAFVSLSEDFRKYFAKKGFTPDTVAKVKDDILYMDAVMEKIKKINRANIVLRTKYKDDEKFVRIHKRIVEENKRRQNLTPKGRVLISESDVDIVNGLNAIKKEIDMQIYLDYNKLSNFGFFNQLVMMKLATTLDVLQIETPRPERNWMRTHIVNQYMDGYERDVI